MELKNEQQKEFDELAQEIKKDEPEHDDLMKVPQEFTNN